MFKQYQFKSFINEAIEKELKFQQPTKIQKRVIPRILKGEDVIGKSQTGTGKTHAFLLPVLNELTSSKDLDICIIVPTRELALQLYHEVTRITKFCNYFIDVRLFVGGTDRDQEMSRLEKSQPKIAIGTIGKIKDLAVNSNLLKIHTAKTVIIDEADMVFESSEIEEVDNIFAKFSETVQVLIFSATLPQDIISFLNKYFFKFEIIDLTDNKVSKETITHIFIPTKNKNKDELLVALLNSFHPYLALIFANTKTQVDLIADYLSVAGFKVGKLTGDLEPRARKQVLKRIKDGIFQYVVASDIAARGIDITGVSHVINYELPEEIDFFIHRTGRTARASLEGISISFYDFEDDSYLNKLEAKGLKCVYMALKDGQLVETKERNAREKRTRPQLSVESQVHASIPVPKKVKPGYKKKRKDAIDKQVRKLKRAKIDEIYRRKAKKS